jgi:hypothetical protein
MSCTDTPEPKQPTQSELTSTKIISREEETSRWLIWYINIQRQIDTIQRTAHSDLISARNCQERVIVLANLQRDLTKVWKLPDHVKH